MSRRPKFKPEIIRVRLNPEQAVLQCPCYDKDLVTDAERLIGAVPVCIAVQELIASTLH